MASTKKSGSGTASASKASSSKAGTTKASASKVSAAKAKNSKARNPGPSVKDKTTYETLRDEGASKEKAARIANASANRGRAAVGKKGGKAADYEKRTVPELRERAKELGITGYSKLRKDALIDQLRNH